MFLLRRGQPFDREQQRVGRFRRVGLQVPRDEDVEVRLVPDRGMQGRVAVLREELNPHAARVRPVLRVRFVRLEGDAQRRLAARGADGVDQRPRQRVGARERFGDAAALRFGAAGVEVDRVEGLVGFHGRAVEFGAGRGGLRAEGLGDVFEQGGGLGGRRSGLLGGLRGWDVDGEDDVAVEVFREVFYGVVDVWVRVAYFFDAGV